MTREDLIKWQNAFAKTYAKYPPEAYQAINETIKILQEPERKHGEWMDVFSEVAPNPMYMYGECSDCGFMQNLSKRLPFCPNCGAIMDGKNGEQE